VHVVSSGGDGRKAAPGAPLGELDPRRTVYRRDLAAKSLYGKVSVPRYAQPVPAQVVRSAVPLRDQPSASRGFLTEALYGELVDVYEERDGWAWIQLKRDRYVGYVPADALTQNIVEPTHRVRALGTFVYPSPDIKTPPVMHLSLNAQVRVVGANETFCALEAGGFVVARHVTETGRFARDFVEIAERFIGTPYLWGGRTRIGIDCSGLVQVSLEAAGMKAPRDTDMQQAELGYDIAIDESYEGYERGDLVFWKGHVGIMADAVTLVHANAHHMAVTAETLPEAVQRIAKSGSEVLAIKRLTEMIA
jgi:cell wall-associated NlpC family hydrolase